MSLGTLNTTQENYCLLSQSMNWNEYRNLRLLFMFIQYVLKYIEYNVKRINSIAYMIFLLFYIVYVTCNHFKVKAISNTSTGHSYYFYCEQQIPRVYNMQNNLKISIQKFFSRNSSYTPRCSIYLLRSRYICSILYIVLSIPFHVKLEAYTARVNQYATGV